MICCDVCTLRVDDDVGIGMSRASNGALQVFLRVGREGFKQFIKIPHTSNVAERKYPLSFGIEVTTVQ